MKSNMLGLQPRVKNIVSKLDERPLSPGISTAPLETYVSMRPELQTNPFAKGAMVQLPSATNAATSESDTESESSQRSAIPENTIV
jgi:hypothetical protein